MVLDKQLIIYSPLLSVFVSANIINLFEIELLELFNKYKHPYLFFISFININFGNFKKFV